MHAQVPIETIKKIRDERHQIIKGVLTITLDHNMEKYHIMGDNEALVSDWENVRSDIRKALKVISIERL